MYWLRISWPLWKKVIVTSHKNEQDDIREGKSAVPLAKKTLLVEELKPRQEESNERVESR